MGITLQMFSCQIIILSHAKHCNKMLKTVVYVSEENLPQNSLRSDLKV